MQKSQSSDSRVAFDGKIIMGPDSLSPHQFNVFDSPKNENLEKNSQVRNLQPQASE